MSMRAERISQLYDGLRAADTLIAKALVVDELAQTARIETKLREYIAVQWEDLAKQASRTVTARLRQGKGPVTDAEITRLTKLIDRTMNQWPGRVSERYTEDMRETYELAHVAANKRALGRRKRGMEYTTRPWDTGKVEKAVPIPAAEIVANFDLVDLQNMDAFEDQQLFWIGQHYGKNVSRHVHDTARAHIIEQGRGRVEAGKTMQKVVNTALNEVRVPGGFNGTAKKYFEGLVANSATVQRNTAQLNAFTRAGLSRITIVNPSDHRTCFPASAPVLLSDGTYQAIQDISLGQKVVTREGREKTVTGVFRKRAKHWAKIIFEDGRTLISTVDHELAEHGGGWVEAASSQERWVERLTDASQQDVSRLRNPIQCPEKPQQGSLLLEGMQNGIRAQPPIRLPSMRAELSAFSLSGETKDPKHEVLLSKLQAGGIPRGRTRLSAERTRIPMRSLRNELHAFLPHVKTEKEPDLLFLQVPAGSPKSQARQNAVQGLQEGILDTTQRTAAIPVLLDQVPQPISAWRIDGRSATAQLLDLREELSDKTSGDRQASPLLVPLLSQTSQTELDRAASIRVPPLHGSSSRTGSENWQVDGRLSDLRITCGRSGRILLALESDSEKARCQKDGAVGEDGLPSREARRTRRTGGIQANKIFTAWASQVVSVEVFEREADAFDIEVEDDHSYVVGPGVVVHNCSRCDNMNGRVFEIKDANRVATQLRNAKDPTEVRKIQPFMSVADSKLSNAALVERGNVFAPFHFKCFLGNTEVLTRRGFRRIDSIEAGEEVLTHKRNWRRVARAFYQPYSGELVRVDGVVSTADHPYLIKRNGRNLFDAVRETDHVASFDQQSIRYHLPEIERLWEDAVVVWNLTVEEDESYVVRRYNGAGLIVHNCRCNMDITEEEELIPVL